MVLSQATHLCSFKIEAFGGADFCRRWVDETMLVSAFVGVMSRGPAATT